MKKSLLLLLFSILIAFSFISVAKAKDCHLSETEMTIKVGSTAKLKVKGTKKKITWSSSDKKIISVKNGKITAKASGTAVITAKVGKSVMSCHVTVKKTGIRVHMLDIGHGDAILIQVSNKNILIDTGEEKYYEQLKTQLDHFRVKKVDSLILTHPDSDHIGSADKVIANYDVTNVYMPKKSSSSREYSETISALSSARITPVNPNEGDFLPLACDLTAQVLSVDEGDTNNSASIVMRLDYYNNSFLFTGDAPAKVENTIMSKYDVDVDVLKVAHHGSDYSSPILYLKTVSPEFALISVGAGNSYGHPCDTTINRLEKFAKNILRTDLNGTITIKGDGDTLTSEAEQLITWEEKEVVIKARKVTDVKEPTQIIGNKKSKIYHTDLCDSLPLEKNRIYFDTEEEAITQGYRPHNSCVN
ncbi:MAG: MBL fold metallo-hydrolase [Lachnospiraceae bacterium]|nr:MBL fold metallo-hydrolase [Lachnospiraceae bacterium]